MTHRTIEGRLAPGMTFDAEAHVDFMHRHYAIHRLHVAVTFLALNAGVDVRLMRKAYEVRQRVDAVPLNLEGRRLVVHPGACDRLDAAHQRSPMASDAFRNRRRARSLRAARILMAVLAGNLINAGVDAMAERDGLLDIRARGPGALGKRQRAESEDQQRDS